MDLLRSEPMQLVQLIITVESASLISAILVSFNSKIVFSENIVRLKSSTVGALLTSDQSPIMRIQSLRFGELGVVILAVLLLHSAGFFVGYLSAALCGFKERQRRAISIEIGMQNSSLGVVLATTHFSPSMVAF
ncbi:hypothetical protein Q3G72_026399 [Acer saccharum]|nr:hypothetical protein Q3G72_026399 [Acer saccharum]